MATLKEGAKELLAKRRSILLGVSIGNPHFYMRENLEKLFTFAADNSDQIKVFISDVIVEHNLRALGGANPRKSARKKGKALKNKCEIVISSLPEIMKSKFTYINWQEEVEINAEYTSELAHLEKLFQENPEFYKDVTDVTEKTLNNTHLGRYDKDKNLDEMKDDVKGHFDVEEGAKFFLKELAFFMTIQHTKNFGEYIFVYHRPFPPFLYRLFSGYYNSDISTGGFRFLQYP